MLSKQAKPFEFLSQKENYAEWQVMKSAEFALYLICGIMYLDVTLI